MEFVDLMPNDLTDTDVDEAYEVYTRIVNPKTDLRVLESELV